MSGDGQIVQPAVQRAAGAGAHERSRGRRRIPCFRARAVRVKRSSHSAVHRDPGGFTESGHGDAGAQPHAHLRAVGGLPSRVAALEPAGVRQSPALPTRLPPDQEEAVLLSQPYSPRVLSTEVESRGD